MVVAERTTRPWIKNSLKSLNRNRVIKEGIINKNLRGQALHQKLEEVLN